MTPREYLDVARERWRFIVAWLLLGLVLSAAVTYLVPRQYAASATVIVAAQPTGDAVRTSNDEEISGQRISTYAELLRSRRLAEDVVGQLRLASTPEALAQRITVGTAPDSVLLTATVTDGSPDEAIRIVNAVADQFIVNVAEIEQPADAARSPLVAAKVFQPANPPAELIAPRPVLYLSVGVLLGLLVGIGVAVLRHTLDFRVKTRRQLEDLLGVPVLGTISRDVKIPSSPLVMYGAPHTPLAESFRQLRTNVSFLDVEREHKVVLVTSATSGEGRSTTVANLGLAFAEAGSRVLILDADLRDPSIARLLSVDDAVGLTDVLLNRIPVERALKPIGPTLDVLPSGPLPPNPSELLGATRMVNLLALLRKLYDVVLIDSAPLLPFTDAAVLAPRADGVLVLVRHGRTVVQDVQAAKDALDAVSGRVVGSVMTMVSHVGTRAHARIRPRRGARRPAPPVLSAEPVATRSRAGTEPAQGSSRGGTVTLGDQKTVMLMAPQSGSRPAAPQVPRSAPPSAPPSTHRPPPALPPPAPPQDTTEASPPAPAEVAQAPSPEAQNPAAGQDGQNGAAQPEPQTNEKPAPRPRPRASSDVNGQVLDHDGSATR